MENRKQVAIDHLSALEHTMERFFATAVAVMTALLLGVASIITTFASPNGDVQDFSPDELGFTLHQEQVLGSGESAMRIIKVDGRYTQTTPTRLCAPRQHKELPPVRVYGLKKVVDSWTWTDSAGRTFFSERIVRFVAEVDRDDDIIGIAGPHEDEEFLRPPPTEEETERIRCRSLTE